MNAIRTTCVSEYGGIWISNTSSVFLIGMAMDTHVVGYYKAVFQSFPMLHTGRKD